MRAFMLSLGIAVGLGLTGACTRDGVTTTHEVATTQGQASAGLAVMVSEDGLTTIAFTQRKDKEALESLVDGSTPNEFDWVTVTFPFEMEREMSQPSGLRVDFSDKTAEVTYRQGYRGPCNPAKEDLSACWLVEHVASGESGASGSIDLKQVDGVVSGGWDITIERVTDKFGDPLQWHRYSTSSIVNSPLTQAGDK